MPGLECPQCSRTIPLEWNGTCRRCAAAALLVEFDEPVPDEPVLFTLGDYEILEEIARGGTGIVYRARQVSVDREVAIKVLKAALVDDESAVGRLRAEAAAAGRLQHPHVVPVYELGSAGEQYFLAMALVEGPSLADRTRTGPLPPSLAARIAAQVADAIQHAHERGVLHRDLKPGNVLLDADDEPHITDFGIARVVDRDASLTITGQLLGTPAYMAPEQAVPGSQVGWEADVYGIGAVLYHLLTGRAPFVGQSLAQVLRNVAEQEPLSPQSIQPGVPSDLASVCLKALQKNPQARYASAAALAADLRRFLAGEPTVARPPSQSERFTRWVRRNPGLAGAIGCAALSLLLGTGFSTWQWGRARQAVGALRSLLWKSHLMEAQDSANRRAPGQRLQTLELVRKAAQDRPSPELRNVALAALVLPDLELLPYAQPACPAFTSAFLPPRLAVAPNDGRFALWWSNATAQVHVQVSQPADHTAPPLRLQNNDTSGDEMVFSPDGRWLAVRYFFRHLVVVWDTFKGQKRWEQSIERGPMMSLEFSPDSSVLAVASRDWRLHLFEADSGAELRTLVVPHSFGDWRARFGPKPGQLVTAAGTNLTFWDWRTGSETGRRTFLRGLSFALAWHPSGEQLALTWYAEPEITLLDLNYQTQRVWRDTGLTFQLDYHPDGTLLVGRSRDGHTRLWDVATDRLVLETRAGLASGFSHAATQLHFDREFQEAGAWRLHRATGYQTFRTPGTASYLGGVDFNRDGTQLAWGGAHGLAMLDLTSGKLSFTGTGQVRDVRRDGVKGGWRYAGDDGLFQAGADTSHFRTNHANSVDSTADGSVVAWLEEQYFFVVRAGVTSRVELPGKVLGHSLALSPDGRLAAVGTQWDESLLLETTVGRVLEKLPGYRAQFAFHPEGRWLAMGISTEYTLYSTDDWKPLHRWTRDNASAQYSPLATSTDGSMLAVTLEPRMISLLDTHSYEVLAQLASPTPLFVSALRFSPDDSRLAAASEDGIMQIWDLRRLREELRKLQLDWRAEAPHPPR